MVGLFDDAGDLWFGVMPKYFLLGCLCLLSAVVSGGTGVVAV